MPRLVGLSRGKELIFTGRLVSGKEAHSIGLVDRLADPSQSAYDAALALASEILPQVVGETRKIAARFCAASVH